MTTHRRQNHQVPTNQVKVQKGQNSEQDSSTCQKVYLESTMARLQNLLLLLLLVTPTILQIANPGNHTFDKDFSKDILRDVTNFAHQMAYNV